MIGEDIMLNMEGLSPEAKIGKILILIGVIISILAVIILGIFTGIIWTSGEIYGLGIFMTVPQWIITAILVFKVAGLLVGILALCYAGRNDFTKAGIFAVISCILPPLDLIMLIGGIFCLVSREANEVRTPPRPSQHVS
jgi:hypothetical protein